MSDPKMSSTSAPAGKNLFAEVMEAVTTASKGLPPEGVSGILKGAVRDALGRGGDLMSSMKAILMGLLRGTGAREAAATKLLAVTAKDVIRETAGLGGDLESATKGLVLAAIASARSIGIESAAAATTIAQAALEGAGEAGSVAVERVIRALQEPIGGGPVAFVKPPVR